MTGAAFRKLALALPQAEERAHMRHPDFRVGGRIFATLGYPRPGWAMVKLTPEEQEAFVAMRAGAFVPVKGRWGEQGCTNVVLRRATGPAVRAALAAAHQGQAARAARAGGTGRREAALAPTPRARPLWRCPRCGRSFANRNQSHACGRHTLASHFAGKPPQVRALFDAVRAAVRRLGPVRVLPEQTRIAFQARMSFAQVTPRRGWLDGHVVLARRLEDPRFRRIESLSPRNHVHHFRIARVSEVDARFRAWLAEAYEVGRQRHLA